MENKIKLIIFNPDGALLPIACHPQFIADRPETILYLFDKSGE